MSTELVVHGQPTGLSIEPEQTAFTEQQVTVLTHLGVENASEGDLTVFFHVCKRTGLDPFAHQIHMIGRNSKNQRTDKWEVKYTIQTGIDGYRLIGRRAADAARVSIDVRPPSWADESGRWHDLWLGAQPPAAARATILRDGHEFTAVALFAEYKQTRKDGALTSMWQQRPAGQLQKCAEALAWRMAFPQDLSGLYVEEEMQQADIERPAPVTGTGAERMRGALRPTEPVEPVVDEPVADATETAAPVEPVEPATPCLLYTSDAADE